MVRRFRRTAQTETSGTQPLAFHSLSQPAISHYNQLLHTHFILVNTLCPPGWFFPIRDSVKIGRLSVETGMTVLYEIEEGRFRFTGASWQIAEKQTRKPLADFLTPQGRFQSLLETQKAVLQKWGDRRWNTYLTRTGFKTQPSI